MRYVGRITAGEDCSPLGLYRQCVKNHQACQCCSRFNLWVIPPVGNPRCRIWLFSLVVTISGTVGWEAQNEQILSLGKLLQPAALLGYVTVDAMFLLPVFLRPISRDTGWSITEHIRMTFGFLAMALATSSGEACQVRFGPRVMVLIGSSVLARLWRSRAVPSLIEFQLIFGVGVGGATAIFAAVACVTGWFDTHRNLAVVSRFRRHWD